jgi:hypothetical protein
MLGVLVFVFLGVEASNFVRKCFKKEKENKNQNN